MANAIQKYFSPSGSTDGNTYYGIALTEMLKRAEKSGFKVVALGAFIARHSIDPTFAA